MWCDVVDEWTAFKFFNVGTSHFRNVLQMKTKTTKICEWWNIWEIIGFAVYCCLFVKIKDSRHEQLFNSASFYRWDIGNVKPVPLFAGCGKWDRNISWKMSDKNLQIVWKLIGYFNFLSLICSLSSFLSRLHSHFSYNFYRSEAEMLPKDFLAIR